MAVTKQTYSLSSGWTYSQLAGLFRSAFIDAGYMTDWYDSFLSGLYENRILRVVYDGSKTYGTTYYWFQFNASFSRISLLPVTGWDVVNHIPTGTQYVDYYSTSTSTENGTVVSQPLSTTTALSLVRFTSAVNSTHSWFRLKQGTSFTHFTLARPEHTVASWIDLDKTYFNHFIRTAITTATNGAQCLFYSQGSLRRSYGIGTALIGETTRRDICISSACYGVPGRLSNSTNNNIQVAGSNYNSAPTNAGIVLPNAVSANNSAYASNYNPVYTGIPYSMYMTNSNLPSDFGIIAHYTNNTLAIEDTFVVTAGVEEWEIINFVNNTSSVGTHASMAFAARIV